MNKLGLLDPTPGAVKLRLASYVNFRQLAMPPPEFGHYKMIKDWKMLANDKYGCCAWTGGEHMSMMFCAETHRSAPFSDASTLKNYASTGFQLLGPDGQPWPIDPETGEPDNPTDSGTGIDDLAKHWRKTGLVDDTGHRHKIIAYLDMNPGDLRELWLATWLFQATGMGFALPESAQEQTAAGRTWDYVAGSPIVGGHFVPNFGRAGAAGLGVGVTWDKVQPFTGRFYQRFNNQGIVVLTQEAFIRAKTIDGVDDVMLADDLKHITAV